MGSFSGIEMILVAAVVLLVFGAGWLPKMARKAGQSKVHVERAKAEYDKTVETLNAPIKGVTDAVSKVDKTLNAKPTDLVKKLATPAAAAAAAPPVDPAIAETVAEIKAEAAAETGTPPESAAATESETEPEAQ